MNYPDEPDEPLARQASLKLRHRNQWTHRRHPFLRMATAFSTAADAARPATYTRTAIALHWALALALVGSFSVGTYMVGLSFSPMRLKLYNWHKWAGITILTFSALRLLWRSTHRPPDLPAAIARRMPPWQHLAHDGTHYAMYALFFAVPLIGWAYSSASGFQVVVFGHIPLPDLVSPDKALAATLKLLHKWAAWSLAALVLLHVAAALKHQWVDRDRLIRRMWP